MKVRTKRSRVVGNGLTSNMIRDSSLIVDRDRTIKAAIIVKPTVSVVVVPRASSAPTANTTAPDYALFDNK